jgi:hypothetical protein
MHALSKISLLMIGAATFGCSARHVARLDSPRNAPPVEGAVLHASRLWIELRHHTADKQCRQPRGERGLCFVEVHRALGDTLRQSLWSSFPGVALKGHGDGLRPGDYLLLVDVKLEPVPPGTTGPGWSASARGGWRLVRDGFPVAGARIESSSRATYPYGSSLAVAARDVLDAVAVHVAEKVAVIPETRPLMRPALPQVTTKDGFGLPDERAIATSVR